MRLTYAPGALRDLKDASRYYEGESPSLRQRFEITISEALAELADAPTRWRIVSADIRRMLVETFPYAIVYRILPDRVRVLAFQHHSRSPGYWRHRR